ncbi:ElyC/SanA/YdcF family protein [Micromonospora sp. NPDC005367]|uniref:ElyC/SanA/YdcF family protein n=1 Tax=Micromonospora sp. NPDC005367 TaxID=3155590 RepID=UPI0033A2EEA4
MTVHHEIPPRDGPTPRVVRAAELAHFTAAQLLDVTTAVMAILALPQSAADRAEALVVPTGQGEQWRLIHAIRRWEANRDIRHLLVANGNPAEETYQEITLAYLRRLGLRRLDGVRLQAEAAPNTGLQAAWIADQVKEFGITSLALSVSAYHLPRVYLTVLKSLSRIGVRLPLIPDPVTISPDAAAPETQATAYDLLPGEVARILRYVDEGWVATFDDLQRYLRWLWSDHETFLTGNSG